jgi:hypothetical protein
MNRLTAPVFRGAVLLVLATGIARADEARKPDEAPAKPPELKVLDRLVGTWKDEVIFKVSESNPTERRETWTYSNEWTLKGRFLQSRGRKSDGKDEDLQFMTFDPETKAFRKWYFSPDGYVAEASGQWDEKTSTLTWTNDLGDGVTGVSTWRFADENTIVWSRITKDKKGKVHSHIEGKGARQK